jgi:hypothetical protein
MESGLLWAPSKDGFFGVQENESFFDHGWFVPSGAVRFPTMTPTAPESSSFVPSTPFRI